MGKWSCLGGCTGIRNNHMKRYYALGVTLAMFTAGVFAADQITGLGPDEALKLLKEGNARFAAGKVINPDTGVERRLETATEGQHPFAIVLACSDSRVPVERIFDRGVGDIFVIRVAGNVCGTNEAASIEYAIEHLGPRLLVVLGHSQCGAVAAAINGGDAGPNVNKLLTHIKPAVEHACKNNEKIEGEQCLDAAIKENVSQSIKDMISISAVIRDCEASKNVVITGAVYDVGSGKIEWIGTGTQDKASPTSSNTETGDDSFVNLQFTACEWMQGQPF
jgi:carbonic anhydrase